MRAAALALVLALLGCAFAGDEPRARTLGDDAPPRPGVDADPGRALPRTTAICRDAGTRRCWTAPREPDCAPAGRLYRIVIDAPDQIADALAGCREDPPR
jgi:hypothetical protein